MMGQLNTLLVSVCGYKWAFACRALFPVFSVSLFDHLFANRLQFSSLCLYKEMLHQISMTVAARNSLINIPRISHFWISTTVMHLSKNTNPPNHIDAWARRNCFLIDRPLPLLHIPRRVRRNFIFFLHFWVNLSTDFNEGDPCEVAINKQPSKETWLQMIVERLHILFRCKAVVLKS